MSSRWGCLSNWWSKNLFVELCYQSIITWILGSRTVAKKRQPYRTQYVYTQYTVKELHHSWKSVCVVTDFKMLFLHKSPQIVYAFLFYFRMNHYSMQNETHFFFCSRQKLYSIFGFGSCPGAIMKYTVRIWNIVETCPQQRVWWWASTWV